MNSSRGQAAIEFLITNGWAILVVVILLAVLFYIGVLSPQNTTPNTCLFQPGFSCYTFKVGNVTGSLELDFGQATGRSIQVTGISCSQNSTAALHTSPLSEDITVPSGEHRWITGGTSNNSATCEGATGEAGARYKGQVCINYIESGTSTQRLVCGEINARLEPASAAVTPVPPAQNIALCDPYTPWPNGSLIDTPGNYALGSGLIETQGGDCIDITASNVTLNCGGHSIAGQGGGFAVYLEGASGVAVSNCVVNHFNTGVYLASSSDNSVSHCSATNGADGFYVQSDSYGNNFTGNTADSNAWTGIYVGGSGNNFADNAADSNAYYGILLDGSATGNNFSGNTANSNNDTGFIVSSDGNNFTGNTATGNANNDFTCWGAFPNNIDGGNSCYSQSGCSPAEGGWLYTCPIPCQDPIVACCVISSTGTYTLAHNLTSNGVSSCITITQDANGSTLDCGNHGIAFNGDYCYYSSGAGIELDGASGVTVRDCTVKNLNYGMLLNSASGNNISNNHLTVNCEGIQLLYSSDNNSISGNNVSGNRQDGITLFQSNGNNLTDNTFKSQESTGVSLYDSSDNNFTGNTVTDNQGLSDFYCSDPVSNFDGGNTCGTQYGCGPLEAGWLTTCPSPAVTCTNPITECCTVDAADYYTVANDIDALTTCISFSDSTSGSTLDCRGKIIAGPGKSGNGIYVPVSSSGVTVKNCNVRNFQNGIYASAHGINITDSEFDFNNQSGIYLISARNSNVTGSIANSNLYGIFLTGSSSSNNITGNTADANAVAGIIFAGDCRDNNVEDNTLLFNNYYGINVGASGNTFKNNNAHSNQGVGIFVYQGVSDNEFTGNAATDNSYDFYCMSAGSNIDNGNTCNNTRCDWLTSCPVAPPTCTNPITSCCMINSTATYTLAGNMTASGTCIIINSGGSGSTLDCGGSKITGPSSNNGYTGIYLNRVNSVTVTGCKVTKFGNGIKLASSNSSSVLGNYLFQEYGNGIAVTSSRSNIISDNNATSNAVGIYLEKSSLNSVSGNNCSSNDLGFSILDSTDNNVTNNIANFNTGRGMLLHGSSPHNNLTGNAACGNHQENIYCNQFQVDGGSNTCTQTGCNVTCGTCP